MSSISTPQHARMQCTRMQDTTAAHYPDMRYTVMPWWQSGRLHVCRYVREQRVVVADTSTPIQPGAFSTGPGSFGRWEHAAAVAVVLLAAHVLSRACFAEGGSIEEGGEGRCVLSLGAQTRRTHWHTDWRTDWCTHWRTDSLTNYLCVCAGWRAALTPMQPALAWGRGSSRASVMTKTGVLGGCGSVRPPMHAQPSRPASRA